MRKIYLPLVLTLFFWPLIGQYQINLIPRKSPDKGVYHRIGYTDIDISYGSPKVNDRKIWGTLVPYGELWRAGANVATTMEFSQDIYIKGEKLPKGRYAFFVIPRESGVWTVIFSNKPDQWGAYGHLEEEEMLRFDLKAEQSHFTEELMYRVYQNNFETGEILMDWENIRIRIPFRTVYLDLLEKELEYQLSKSSEHLRWILYLQAGEYLFNEKKRINKALEWINKGEELSNVNGEWDPRFYPKEYILGHLYWTKAKILAQMADYDKAIDYALLMKKQGGKYDFYEEENEFESIDAQVENWAIKASR